MSNNTKATTFWNFLKENTIEIPIIQRDYAQGRLGKENLRKNFLADLKKALGPNETMKLDFVYGSIENDNLNPLDGQQRLTTLWLLHWYIALRAGELNEDNCKTFRKFTYETRISSREFSQKLCVPEYFQNFDGKDIVGFITKRTWFYSAWKQDPTIQSMLRMLGGTKIADKKGEDIIDGIEELFQETNEDGFKSYWEKLTKKEVIVFYHLPLKDFGLSDDLYIKMNARGKQLTSFENFKADLIGYITKQVEDNPESKWTDLLDAENGIPIKLDKDWTDIFWKNKSIGVTDKESKKRKSDHIDEIYFAFLNRFFWNELFLAKKTDDSEEYILDIGKGDESSTQENNNPSYKYLNNSEHNNDATIAYKGLDVYRYDNGNIPLLFFQKIKRVLDNYFAYNNCLPECPWETSFRFIPIYEVKNDNNIEIINNTNDKILSVSTLNQVQRIVFFAVCKYFDHDDKVSDSETSLKRWMRVVWNLVSGEDQNGHPEIRSTSAMRSAMEFIDKLDSHDVYNCLANFTNKLSDSEFDKRCKEEIAKTKQILDKDGKLRQYKGIHRKEDGSTYYTWEEIIIDAEKYAFFKGAIRFLFTDGDGNPNWRDFDTKWGKAKEYFDKNGVKEIYQENAKFLRCYISKFTQWRDFWDFNYDYKPETWKNLLLSNRYYANNSLLTEDINIREGCYESILLQTMKNSNSIDVESQKHIRVMESLIHTTILVEASKYSSCLNYRYNVHSLYPHNTKARWKIYVIDGVRNKLLSELCDKNIVILKDNKRFDDFFWDWDVDFTYKEKKFRWYRNDYIYLMGDSNPDEYIIKNETMTYDIDKFFCFEASRSTTENSFCKELDNLISDRNKNISTKN